MRDSGRFLGHASVHTLAFKLECVELSYWVRSEAAGQGYIYEAVGALEHYLFSRGFHRVEIRCAGVPLLEVVPELREILVRQDHAHETVFMLDDDTRLNEVIDWLLRRGAQIRVVTPQRTSLEDMFLAAAGPRIDGRMPDRRTA